MDKDNDLSLEKLKISERMRNLEISNARLVSHVESESGTFARYTAEMHRTVERLEAMLKRHDEILLGNGRAGLVMKMDRLEQIENNRAWQFRAIWTSISGLVVKFIWDLMGKR